MRSPRLKTLHRKKGWSQDEFAFHAREGRSR